MHGKLINNKLIIAGEKIQVLNGWITKPSEEELRINGYKEIEYMDRPEYDEEEEKLVESFNELNDKIIVFYEKVILTIEEHNMVIQNKIIEEENKMTPRRQREIDLNKEGALEFAQEIENNIIELRKKFRKEEN